MKNSSLDYMHRLLAESLYRGYSGARPSHEEATLLAAHSVRWFRELLLRLSIQHCIEETAPIGDLIADREAIDDAVDFDDTDWPDPHQLEEILSRDEALWNALCEGSLVLRIEGSEVNASVVPTVARHLMH